MRIKPITLLTHSNLLGFSHYIYESLDSCRYLRHLTIINTKIASRFIGNDDREVFFVMCLNTKNHVVAVHRCHVGSLNASIVHPREVFKSAILNNAASIIVAHQHPSGDTTPSMEDINVTKRLVEAGKLLGIEVLDHLIVNNTNSYTSLKEKSYI